MPEPADRYCTAPLDSDSLLPILSWWVSCPSSTYEKISASRWGWVLHRHTSSINNEPVKCLLSKAAPSLRGGTLLHLPLDSMTVVYLLDASCWYSTRQSRKAHAVGSAFMLAAAATDDTCHSPESGFALDDVIVHHPQGAKAHALVIPVVCKAEVEAGLQPPGGLGHMQGTCRPWTW